MSLSQEAQALIRTAHNNSTLLYCVFTRPQVEPDDPVSSLTLSRFTQCLSALLLIQQRLTLRSAKVHQSLRTDPLVSDLITDSQTPYDPGLPSDRTHRVPTVSMWSYGAVTTIEHEMCLWRGETPSAATQADYLNLAAGNAAALYWTLRQALRKADEQEFTKSDQDHIDAILSAFIVLRRHMVEKAKADMQVGEGACCVCAGQLPDVVMLPCRHLVACGLCLDRMGDEDGEMRCPVCRAVVQETIDIFRA